MKNAAHTSNPSANRSHTNEVDRSTGRPSWGSSVGAKVALLGVLLGGGAVLVQPDSATAAPKAAPSTTVVQGLAPQRVANNATFEAVVIAKSPKGLRQVAVSIDGKTYRRNARGRKLLIWKVPLSLSKPGKKLLTATATDVSGFTAQGESAPVVVANTTAALARSKDGPPLTCEEDPSCGFCEKCRAQATSGITMTGTQANECDQRCAIDPADFLTPTGRRPDLVGGNQCGEESDECTAAAAFDCGSKIVSCSLSFGLSCALAVCACTPCADLD